MCLGSGQPICTCFYILRYIVKTIVIMPNDTSQAPDIWSICGHPKRVYERRPVMSWLCPHYVTTTTNYQSSK